MKLDYTDGRRHRDGQDYSLLASSPGFPGEAICLLHATLSAKYRDNDGVQIAISTLEPIEP